MLDVWNKAVLYHFVHAIALFALAFFGTVNRGAWILLFAGIMLFSGSLYTMALTNVRWLGAITATGRPLFPGRLGLARHLATENVEGEGQD